MPLKKQHPKPPEKLIGLIRVSTDVQDQSGLGQEAQAQAIEVFRQRVGGELIATCEEVESGKHHDIAARPKLRAAVAHAKHADATLVIAKLDRPVCSIDPPEHLKLNGVKFVACDLPAANELTIDLLVAVAANEARVIGQRTKDALQAYKDSKRAQPPDPCTLPQRRPSGDRGGHGGKLGASLPQCKNLKPEHRRRGTERASAVPQCQGGRVDADIAPYVAELRRQGATLQAIADQLNAEGHKTSGKRQWSPPRGPARARTPFRAWGPGM